MSWRVVLWSVVSLSWASACAGPQDDEAPVETSTPETASETGDTNVEVGPCETLGLAERAFSEGPYGEGLWDVAEDFTIETTAGSFSLREAWTGCDTVLIMPNRPAQVSSWQTDPWSRDLDTLFERLPKNTQVVFIDTASLSSSEITANITAVESSIGTVLAQRDDREWWEGRVHFATEPGKFMDSWVGRRLKSPGYGIGIDRYQRIRDLGSLSDGRRYVSAQGWFDTNIAQWAYEAQHYNFEVKARDTYLFEGHTKVPVFEKVEMADPGWAGARTEATFTLPDAATMATYDTLHAELDQLCVGEGEYGNCPAWDYLVYAYLCEETDTDRCSVEFGRWITTYHREGRWFTDLTPLLPLLASGGERRMQFYTQQKYEISLSLILGDHPDRSERPIEASYLFGGGAFNATYNDKYEPVEVEVPAAAKRTELVVVISGHGQINPGNCAEFCVTDHVFNINGKDHILSLDDAGTQDGCELDVENGGTVPNQYGTWFYGRSNWCPGREVDPIVIDVTSDVTAGGKVTVTYEGTYQGAPYTAGGANMVMNSWLTSYE